MPEHRNIIAPPPRATSGWHNFDTGAIDWHQARASLTWTADQYEPYIPTCPGARQLFRHYVEHEGRSPMDAYVEVLERLTGGITARALDDHRRGGPAR